MYWKDNKSHLPPIRIKYLDRHRFGMKNPGRCREVAILESRATGADPIIFDRGVPQFSPKCEKESFWK